MSWLRTLLGIVALVTLAMVAHPSSVLALIEMRFGPGWTYEVMAKVQSGESYIVVAQQQDWYKIQLPDGREGWIHRFYAGRSRTSWLRINISDSS
jgi:N-acetylmuramoyl-L-alanine amidase